MKIRQFNFPTFEEWNKTKVFHEQIGEYAGMIYHVNKNSNGTSTYFAVFELSREYTQGSNFRFYFSSYQDETEDIEKLKQWYKEETSRLNQEWVRFITNKYTYTSLV